MLSQAKGGWRPLVVKAIVGSVATLGLNLPIKIGGTRQVEDGAAMGASD